MDSVQAIVQKLRSDSTILSLLPSNTNGIIQAGMLSNGVPSGLLLPCIAIYDGGNYGGARSLPFSEQIVELRIYDNANPNQITYININRIAEECIRALHLTTLDSNMSYQSDFDVYYDNYISGDLYSEKLKLPYRVVRFRVFGVGLIFYHNIHP